MFQRPSGGLLGQRIFGGGQTPPPAPPAAAQSAPKAENCEVCAYDRPSAAKHAPLPLPKKGLKTAAHWAEHDGGKVKEPVLDGAEPHAGGGQPVHGRVLPRVHVELPGAVGGRRARGAPLPARQGLRRVARRNAARRRRRRRCRPVMDVQSNTRE